MVRRSSHPSAEGLMGQSPTVQSIKKRLEAYFSNPFLMNLSQKPLFTMFKHKVQLRLSVVLLVFVYKAEHYDPSESAVLFMAVGVLKVNSRETAIHILHRKLLVGLKLG